MENKPKSRAFIITFIIVIILLFIGYMFLRNMGSNEAKSETRIGKIFESLIGSSKEKKLDPIEKTGLGTSSDKPGSKTNTPGSNPRGTNNPNDPDGTWGSGGLNGSSGGIDGSLGGIDGSLGGTTSGGLSGGDLEGRGLDYDDYSTDDLDSIPKPDTDVPDDSGQPGTDTPGSDIPGIDEATEEEEEKLEETLCPVDDPLSNYFTEQNKKDLDKLLRQFYLIAPSIRTADDIEVAENEILENTSFGGENGQLDQLISDCNFQKSQASYTGPQIVKDNPFYQGGNTSTTYLPGKAPKNPGMNFTLFEKFLYIW